MKKLQIAISLDVSSGMFPCAYPLIKNAKQWFSQWAFSFFDDIEFAFITHGNLANYPISNSIAFSNDVDYLANFCQRIRPVLNGGLIKIPDVGEPACYEFTLQTLANYHMWEEDAEKIIFLIGDSLPYEINQHDNRHTVLADWYQAAQLCARRGIKIYAVQVHGNEKASKFYKTLAQITAGKYIQMRQLTYIFDLLFASILEIKQPNLLQLGILNADSDFFLKELCEQIIENDINATVLPQVLFQSFYIYHNTSLKEFIAEVQTKYVVQRYYREVNNFKQFVKANNKLFKNKVTGIIYSGEQIDNIFNELLAQDINLHERFSLFVEVKKTNTMLAYGTEVICEFYPTPY